MKLSAQDLLYIQWALGDMLDPHTMNAPRGEKADVQKLYDRVRRATPDKPRQRKVSEKARQEHNVLAQLNTSAP